MTTTTVGRREELFFQDRDLGQWSLELQKLPDSGPLVDDWAFAFAIALAIDAAGKPRVRIWSESVELLPPGSQLSLREEAAAAAAKSSS